jgi:predicted HicB family RNase H-like nuclease
MKLPAESWIKRDKTMMAFNVRIDEEVKKETEKAAKKLDTSLNRFTEAALSWYIDALKKDGALK